jgi:hypothetical protein
MECFFKIKEASRGIRGFYESFRESMKNGNPLLGATKSSAYVPLK